jgi:phosphatidylserine decarboxylase
MLRFLLTILPKNYFSFFTGFFAHIPLPFPLNRMLNGWFVNRYGINMQEAERTIDQYPSIGALFTRNLQEGMRPIGVSPVAPVDGTMRSLETITADTLEQVKGKTYSLTELLGDATAADQFQGGVLANFYLAPHNYHHIHTPVTGAVVKRVHIPGALWPVNDWSLHSITRLFAINERIVIYLSTEHGAVALVLVGATNVGSMSLTFDSLRTNQQPWAAKQIDEKVFDDNSRPKLTAGQRIGTFHLGSTVLVLFDKAAVSHGIYPLSWVGREVRYGQSYQAA